MTETSSEPMVKLLSEEIQAYFAMGYEYKAERCENERCLAVVNQHYKGTPEALVHAFAIALEMALLEADSNQDERTEYGIAPGVHATDADMREALYRACLMIDMFVFGILAFENGRAIRIHLAGQEVKDIRRSYKKALKAVLPDIDAPFGRPHFERHAESVGLEPRMYGYHLLSDHKQYRVVGIDKSKRKYNIIIEIDGEQLVSLTADDVLQQIRMQEAAEACVREHAAQKRSHPHNGGALHG